MYLSQMNLIGPTLNDPTQCDVQGSCEGKPQECIQTNERVDRECDSWDKNNGKLLEDVRWEKNKMLQKDLDRRVKNRRESCNQ